MGWAGGCVRRPSPALRYIAFPESPRSLFVLMEILPYIVLLALFIGDVLWSWGCFACCALVITAPVGALLCRAWAGRQGDDVARRTWVGAACWAAGFLPWVYLACEINGWTVPRKTIKAAYAALFIAWLWGPIIGGFFSASLSSSDAATLFPVVSLLAWLVSLVWVGFVGITPDRSPRFHLVHLVPGILMTLSMLAWLPYNSWVA